MRPTRDEIRSIYDGIETRGIQFDPQGWNSDTPIFRELITRLKPRTIVEVGAWKGASTIHMASLCKELGLDTIIYSVDCWVGPLGVRLAKTPPSPIPAHWTLPTFYQQFLYNIWSTGHHDMVIPFQAMSVPAARVLQDWRIQAELVFVDAAHDYYSAREDIKAYWPIVLPGGVMLGDDYRSQKHVHGEWDVGRAVREIFTINDKPRYHITNDTKDAQWWVPKAA